MAARSLGSRASLLGSAVVAVTSGEGPTLGNRDGRSKLPAGSSLARRGTGLLSRPAPRVSDSEHLDLLIRALSAFVRVEIG